jgi:hypothetical protein
MIINEYRVQIQILLHFYLLQHPSPPPPPPTASPKKRSRKKQLPAPVPLEDRLESLMDKLAMWQLLTSVSAEQYRRFNAFEGKNKLADDRDWMQRFCEDIVQPA